MNTTIRCAECGLYITLATDPRCWTDAGEDRDGNPVEIPICRDCRDEEWKIRNGWPDRRRDRFLGEFGE